ncbi:TldD/PmbA family protein [soil metagenome]
MNPINLTRRDFLALSATAAAGFAVGCAPGMHGVAPSAQLTSAAADARWQEMALLALDTARAAGADHVDVRVSRHRNQNVATREQRVTALVDNESLGLGVRVLTDGAWGFAGTGDLSREEVQRAARDAVAQSRANRSALLRPVTLAPADAPADAYWRSPIEIDPFTVPVEEKVELLLAANAAALTVRGARFANSSMSFVGEEKLYMNSDGASIYQEIFRCWPQLSVTAVAADGSDFQSRNSTPVQPMGLGYEHVLRSDLVGNAPSWAEDAVMLLSARPVDPGDYDLVLLPSHLFLTIHESVAHPTELDRILGFEANYAGTSFINPLEEYLGRFRYGQDVMQIQGERSAPGGLSTVGYDDEGVRPQDYMIVRDGILTDLQTTRELVHHMEPWYRQAGIAPRSHGQSYAQTWADVQFQRMPNINLLPDPARDTSVEELISGVRRGILIEGRGSYSIDQQRYNAQFGGQTYHEIRDGRLQGMLRDAAYQIRTPEFWNSMDAVGGPSTYQLGGTFNDGKGQPSQSNAVSHGCPAARFRNVSVIRTG